MEIKRKGEKEREKNSKNSIKTGINNKNKKNNNNKNIKSRRRRQRKRKEGEKERKKGEKKMFTCAPRSPPRRRDVASCRSPEGERMLEERENGRLGLGFCNLGENVLCSAAGLVNGGREGRPIGAYELAKAVEELGAGEILLNCIDCDGQGKGFDIDLVKLISDAVNIPVIASSGAGAAGHFSEVFKETNASAALAAGIFHRKEVPVQAVKQHLLKEGIEVRM